MNASDDRSAEVLRDTLSRAMQSNTVFGDGRPNCVILDEIDGIDGRSSIDALVKIIKAPLRKNSKKGTKGDGKAIGGGFGELALTRPLICICNDQYSPALRELRKMSQIFVFTCPPEVCNPFVLHLTALFCS